MLLNRVFKVALFIQMNFAAEPGVYFLKVFQLFWLLQCSVESADFHSELFSVNWSNSGNYFHPHSSSALYSQSNEESINRP